jgi:hypothetical protein
MLEWSDEYVWKTGMVDSKHLRRMSEQMLAVALSTEDKELSSDLTERACEYLDQASALETAVPFPIKRAD